MSSIFYVVLQRWSAWPPSYVRCALLTVETQVQDWLADPCSRQSHVSSSYLGFGVVESTSAFCPPSRSGSAPQRPSPILRSLPKACDFLRQRGFGKDVLQSMSQVLIPLCNNGPLRVVAPQQAKGCRGLTWAGRHVQMGESPRLRMLVVSIQALAHLHRSRKARMPMSKAEASKLASSADACAGLSPSSRPRAASFQAKREIQMGGSSAGDNIGMEKSLKAFWDSGVKKQSHTHTAHGHDFTLRTLLNNTLAHMSCGQNSLYQTWQPFNEGPT